MNLHEATQHIGECFTLLSTTKFPQMKVVVLLHSSDDEISMVSNFLDIKNVFEVLTRAMSACFDPPPKSDFTAACRSFLRTIQPAVSSLNEEAQGVVCFWDETVKSAAMISSLENVSISFAIICEHIYRTIAGDAEITYGFPTSTAIH